MENQENITAFIIGVISTMVVYVFGQPASVVIMIAGGVALGCYRNVSLDTKGKVIKWMVIGIFITSGLLDLVKWVLDYIKFIDVPINPIGFILGFVLFDVETRAWCVERLKRFLG